MKKFSYIIGSLLVLAGMAVGQSQFSGGGIPNGSLIVSGLVTSEPVIATGPSGATSSSAYIDASIGIVGADACVKMNTAMTLAAGLGLWVDARGFSGKQICSVNPFPNSFSGVLLLGPATFYAQTPWVLGNRVAVLGSGWEANPPPTTPTGTTISGCPSVNAQCAAIFPAGIGGPVMCIGNGAGSCFTSKNASPPEFDSYADHLTVDCAGISGCIAFEDFNGNENSGLRFGKIMNHLRGAGRGILIAGSNFQGNFILTGGVNTFTGAGFTSDMIGTQYKFPTSTDPTTNYLVASINSAGNAGTLDVNFAGSSGTFAGQVNNANTQNGSFWSLYLVSLAANCNDTTSNAGRGILMNTGSGSNKGPREIGDITSVDGCAAANQPSSQIDVSGTALRIDTVHMESCLLDCLLIGANSASSAITVLNPDAGSINIANTGGSVWKISNAFGTEGISVFSTKAIPCNSPCMMPTNLYVDQINGNTLATATKTIEGQYSMMNGTVVTTSQSIPNKMFGLTINGGVVNAGNGVVGGPSVNFGDLTTGFFRPALNTIGVQLSGTENCRFISTGFKCAGTLALQWPNGVIGNTTDLAVGRGAPGTFSLGTTTVNGLGFLQASAVRVTADSSYGTGGNVVTTTAITTIPGLTWTLPLAAQAFKFDCDLLYQQATAGAANVWAVQGATNAPSSLSASATVQLSSAADPTAATYRSGTGTTASTTTLNLLTATPTTTATIMEAHIHGLVRANAAGTILNILVGTGNIADLLTIKADSSCHIEVTAN